MDNQSQLPNIKAESQPISDEGFGVQKPQTGSTPLVSEVGLPQGGDQKTSPQFAEVEESKSTNLVLMIGIFILVVSILVTLALLFLRS